MSRQVATTLITALLFAATPSTADAACYPGQGCTNETLLSEAWLSTSAPCELLWEMRNLVFKENGLCFRTPRAVAQFGNDGCRHQEAGTVPLNSWERENVALLRRIETAKACPR